MATEDSCPLMPLPAAAKALIRPVSTQTMHRWCNANPGMSVKIGGRGYVPPEVVTAINHGKPLGEAARIGAAAVERMATGQGSGPAAARAA